MSNEVSQALARVAVAVEEGSLSTAAGGNLRTWLTQPQYDSYRLRLQEWIAAGRWNLLQDAFWEKVAFGTGGRRGPMGELGTATINERTIAESAHGVAIHVKQSLASQWHRAAIAHDTRNRSQEFARITATVFAAHGLKVFLFSSHRSTPELSFAVRELKCGTGVMITASHNPPADNGFKGYNNAGGQYLEAEAESIIAAVESAAHIPTCDFLTALQEARIEIVGEEIDQPFIRAVVGESLSPNRNVVALFSPCHGVGETSVYRAALAAGFQQVTIHPSQRLPDGNFPFAPDRFPNPERKVVLDALVPLAKQIQADVILASDPDADRIGVASRAADGSFVPISGNRIGVLLADYVLRKRREAGSLKPDHFVVTTLVSTPMLETMAQAQGVVCFSELLVGFKYIASVIDEQGPERFVFGFEESLGYLAGTYARDKDASVASLYLLELAAELKANGQTLLDRMDDLFREHGYFCDLQLAKTCIGEAGRQQIQNLTESLRSKPPEDVGGAKLTQVRDYLRGEVRSLPDNKVTSRIAQPVGDLLIFDGLIEHPQAATAIRIAARPSGTEPKIKFYLFAHPVPGRREELPLSKSKQLRENILLKIQSAVSAWLA